MRDTEYVPITEIRVGFEDIEGEWHWSEFFQYDGSTRAILPPPPEGPTFPDSINTKVQVRETPAVFKPDMSDK